MTLTMPSPFRDSRELGADDPLFREPGVALDLAGLEFDEAMRNSWRNRVERIALQLGWPPPRVAQSQRGDRITIGFSAPAGQLRAARAANEWAVCAALFARDPSHWGGLADASDESAALDRVRRLAARGSG